MAGRRVSKLASGKHLLKTLTDNRSLSTFVQSLSGQRLKMLVDEIGIADAAPIIEYSTPVQLSEMIDDSVWSLEFAGRPEAFDRAEFLSWVNTLLDVGSAFTVERLHALDEDLLVMALMDLLEVTDLDKRVLNTSANEEFHMAGPEELKGLFGPFEAGPRSEQDWDVTQPLLAALDHEDPEFLRALLTRCCNADRTVAYDAAGKHKDRREKQGFVTPESAGGFLNKARDESLNTLLDMTEYDLDTQDYFKRAHKAAVDAATGSAQHQTLLAHADKSPHRLDETESSFQEVEPDPVELEELEVLVTSIELETFGPPTALLSGPATRQRNAVETALSQMVDSHPDALRQRMNEAAYLSNLLMTGTFLEGESLKHGEAAEAVMATCNLGLEFVPQFDLTREPGLVGIFRIGWHILQKLPGEVLSATTRMLQDVVTSGRAGARSWMVEDVIAALSEESLARDLAAGDFEDPRETLQLLNVLFEEGTLDYILRLVDRFPTTVDVPDELHTVQQRRFIETESDLRDVRQYLAALPTRLVL